MAKGHENLIPLNKRTKEEQREIAIMGGKKSGEVRKQNKAVKYYIDLLMSKQLKDEELKAQIKQLGITDDEEITNKMGMIYVHWLEAMKGNTKSFENLLNYSGEKPIEQIQNVEPPKIVDDIDG